ncbi:MAG: Mur ligase family protein [Planctomycetota bacterium]
MKARSLEEIACLLAAPIKGGDGRTPVRGAGIDSRALRRGDLFFALQGSRTHGIRFAGAALAAGAPAVVVELQLAAEVPGRAIPVADPARALGLLAAQVRREEAGHLPAAAITGSVGKTATCGYAATLLAGVRQVHGPRGSHNNALGVPLTILNAPEECDALICEVGSNHPGEIAPLARWIRPEIACVTAVAPAHLDGFGSIAAIEEEKLSLLSALPAGGEAWIPVSLGARGSSLLADCRGRVRSFGPQGDLEVKGGGGRWVL